MQSWIALFSRSPAARVVWKERTGTTIKYCNNTRWWSEWEVKNQLLTAFGDVPDFLQNLGACQANRDRLLAILNGPQRSVELWTQLAIVMDAASPFVRKTYLMDGDGDTVVDAYNNLQEIATATVLRHYPNARAMVKKIADGIEDRYTELIQQAERCIQPAVNFLSEKV